MQSLRSWAPGYDADVIALAKKALAKNPLYDIVTLQEPDKITHVWKSGPLEKCPPAERNN